jgi:glutathione-regulated potassium-efflux system ancillary protein KefF
MILIINANPYPQHSQANKRMLEQVRTLDGVEVRSLGEIPITRRNMVVKALWLP